MLVFCLLFVAGPLLSLSVGQAEKRHLYVKPTPTSSGCPQDEMCMTLSGYLQSVSDYFTSNTTIHFLPGHHTITEPHRNQIIVSNVQNLSLTGHAGDTILHCIERFGFTFVNATFLRISDIRIINCGQTVIDSLLDNTDVYVHTDTKASLSFADVHSLVLHNVQIEKSYGYGLLGVNLLGATIVTNCIFTHNTWRSETRGAPYDEETPGRNAVIIYACDESVLDPIRSTTLSISYCEFSHGVDTTAFDFPSWAESDYRLISGGSGLGVFLYERVNSDNGIHRVNIKINITNSVFHHNNALHGLGGNMFIILRAQANEFKSEMRIDNCTFYGGEALQGGGIFIGSASISGHSSVKFVATVSNSIITDNSATSGGGLCIKAIHAQVEAVIENCALNGNNAMEGAAVYIAGHIQSEFESEFEFPGWPVSRPKIQIIISQTTFLQNAARTSGGGMDINCFTNSPAASLIVGAVMVTCTNCNFNANKAESGYAVSINCVPDQVYLSKISAQFVNSMFLNNGAQTYNEDYCAAVFCIHNTEKIILSNSTFVKNNGSAVYVNGSDLFVSSVVNIIGNHGIRGGGLYFNCNPDDQSFLYLTPHSKLYMANNTASLHGGAIAAQDCSAQTNTATECFIQMCDEDSECEYSRWNTEILTVNDSIACYDSKIIMHDNKAGSAGDSVYGGSLETCYILLYVGDEEPEINFNRIRTSIFEIRNTWSISEITSGAFQVCFCDRNFNINTSNCVTETQADVYHGQTLQIPAVGVGQFNNTSPSVIRTRVAYSTSEFSFGERQTVQEIGRNCGSLTYLFKSSGSKNYKVELHITVETAPTKNSSVPAIVHVTVNECPPGFEFSKDLSTCDCEPHLRRQAIRCDIDSQKIYRHGPIWIGYYQKPLVVIHTNCPFHYCKSEEIGFQLDNQDDQCAFNHSGVLCGACQQGLSLALGTSQCLKCSNIYLLLLIPFALAGIALVFLLLKCNLTVSVGSINGLIFYANIIQVNHPTFFPQGIEGTNLLTKFLSVFIAWLNLDLGIQTCFFTGMTAYTKTWLQFVFPVYVWIMVGFMIYGSRHFPTISRLIGSNAVHVLATLFLLSYAKLLRTVIAVSLSTVLIGKNSSAPLVWLLDGNIQFFRGTHIALFIMALVVVLVYIVPFTALVLLAPCLQASSNRKIRQLVNIKLKPLLDAYQGPYKDKFRYWTGLILLLRTILFAVFAGNVLGKPEINLFVVIVSILLLVIFYWNAGIVYRKLLWNGTESFYLLNLAILSVATLLLRSLEESSSSRSQEIVTDVMLGTAFAVFSAIVLYHFCVYFLKTSVTQIQIQQAMQALLKMYRNPEQPAHAVNLNPNTPAPSNVHTVSHFELNQLREPLLSDTFNN